MAVVIIATAGAVDANSYLTLAEAETYFESSLYSATWAAATDPTKNIALVMATRLLDVHMNWNGSKANDNDSQALDWPRSSAYDKNNLLIDDAIIPDLLKEGAAEFAQVMIAEDRTDEPDTLGIKDMKAGSLAMTFDANDRRKTLPDKVFQMVKSLGSRNSGSSIVDVVRV